MPFTSQECKGCNLSVLFASGYTLDLLESQIVVRHHVTCMCQCLYGILYDPSKLNADDVALYFPKSKDFSMWAGTLIREIAKDAVDAAIHKQGTYALQKVLESPCSAAEFVLLGKELLKSGKELLGGEPGIYVMAKLVEQLVSMNVTLFLRVLCVLFVLRYLLLNWFDDEMLFVVHIGD